MKVNGKSVQPPKPVTVVIPRGDDEYVFTLQAVTDLSEADRLCPEPEPPFKMLPGGTQLKDVTNPEYVALHQEWRQRRGHWLIITSLSATEGLEWSKVEYDKPETWAEYINELKAAGFSNIEIGALMDAVTAVNGLSQDKIDEATKRFLAAAAAQ
jgi:hypothetical protein